MLVVALAGALLFTHGERAVIGAVEAVESVQNWRVSETYWPNRGWMYKLFSIPVKESAIDRHAELAYFVALLPILDEGITHRINRFYERFMRAKAQNRAIELRDPLGDPSLQTTNTELHTARDEIRRLYPDLDPATSSAIEMRFCGFDAL